MICILQLWICMSAYVMASFFLPWWSTRQSTSERSNCYVV